MTVAYSNRPRQAISVADQMWGLCLHTGNGSVRRRQQSEPMHYKLNSLSGMIVETIQIDFANGFVADLLVDVVRGRVAGVGEQKAVFAPAIENILAEGGGAGAGITLAAQFGRRVDRADAHSVRCRAGVADQRNRLPIIEPKE